MKDYLRDYYFVGSLAVAVLSGTMLLGKVIFPLLNTSPSPVAQQNQIKDQTQAKQRVSSVSSTIQTPKATTSLPQVNPQLADLPADEQKVLEEQMDQVVSDEKARNEAMKASSPGSITLAAQPQRAPASVPANSQLPPSQNLPVLKKMRPKQGGNEWLVGKSEHADSNELSSILMNADDSDIVTVESGTYDFGLHMIFVSKIEIRGTKETILNYKDSLVLPKFKELKLTDLEIIFPDNDRNFISVGGNDARFDFTRIKIVHSKLTLNFRDMVQVSISESHFSGVTFRFSTNSKGIIKGSYLEKAKNLISLSNSAQLEVSDTKFTHFENVAISSDTTETAFRAQNIKVTHGAYAFWGKFHKENSQIKDSSFSNLKEFSLAGTMVNCSLCEKYKIER